MNSPLRDPGFAEPSPAGSGTEAFLTAHRQGWEYFGNGLLCLTGLVYNFVMLSDFLLRHRISSLYVALFEAAVIFFSVTRPMPKETNGSPYDWTIALLGSYLIMLMRPAPVVHDQIALLAVQIAGMAISLTGLLSLNKSFGLGGGQPWCQEGGALPIRSPSDLRRLLSDLWRLSAAEHDALQRRHLCSCSSLWSCCVSRPRSACYPAISVMRAIRFRPVGESCR